MFSGVQMQRNFYLLQEFDNFQEFVLVNYNHSGLFLHQSNHPLDYKVRELLVVEVVEVVEVLLLLVVLLRLQV